MRSGWIVGAVSALLGGCFDDAGLAIEPSPHPPPVHVSPYLYVDELERNLHEHHDQDAVVWGVLEIVDHCLIPEGCGPRVRLLGKDMMVRLPVRGEPRLQWDDRLVSVHGTFLPMNEEEHAATNQTSPRHWPETVFEIKEVKLRGETAYTELGPRMIPFIEEWYGCQFPRDQTTYLDFWDGAHHVAVRWNYFPGPPAPADPDRFVTFWFSPADGSITHVQERNIRADPFVCWQPPYS